MKQKIEHILSRSSDRFSFCIHLINHLQCSAIAELGVFRGDFAKRVLENCKTIKTYTMIDPWRNLSHWNKPANKDDHTFEAYYQETLAKTAFAEQKRIILRGKTTEVIGQIEDNSYDLAYIDGDHTLKGISIDLINIWSKVKPDGIIIGDDFSSTIWQHDPTFEPTMVFPFAVYFSEAMNVRIYGLPYNQFLIPKAEKGFEFIDIAGGKYNDLELRRQFLNKNNDRDIC